MNEKNLIFREKKERNDYAYDPWLWWVELDDDLHDNIFTHPVKYWSVSHSLLRSRFKKAKERDRYVK